MVPLISLDLHDDHVTWLRHTAEFTEATFIPAIVVEVFGVTVLPPGIIHAVILQLNAMRLPEIAHHQAPAIEMAEHERTFQQR